MDEAKKDPAAWEVSALEEQHFRTLLNSIKDPDIREDDLVPLISKEETQGPIEVEEKQSDTVNEEELSAEVR